MTALTELSRAALERRGRHLEYLTMGWDLLEAAVAVTAGILAGSSALLGFGLDSLIEASSAGVLLWRFAGGEEREQQALRLVGISLLLLAAYVTIDSVHSLWLGEAPQVSVAGMVIAALALIVMPLLAHFKRRVSAALSSGALHADSRQTDLCAYLSLLLLIGLALNAWLGWWWADPVAALLMVPIIAHEGLEAWRGERC